MTRGDLETQVPSAALACTGPSGLSMPAMRSEKIDFVIVMRALQHGSNALKPHAGVD